MSTRTRSTTDAPSADRRRWLPAASFVVLGAAVAVLSFADRAPDTTRAVLERVRSVGSRIEDRAGYDVIDRGDVPLAFDTVGHVVLWFFVGVVGWWAFGRRTSPGFLALSLFTLSAGAEVGQSFLSTSRRPDLLDLAANGAGVAAGVAVGVMIGGVVTGFGRLLRS